jgi:hypothetical protein
MSWISWRLKDFKVCVRGCQRKSFFCKIGIAATHRRKRTAAVFDAGDGLIVAVVDVWMGERVERAGPSMLAI